MALTSQLYAIEAIPWCSAFLVKHHGVTSWASEFLGSGEWIAEAETDPWRHTRAAGGEDRLVWTVTDSTCTETWRFLPSMKYKTQPLFEAGYSVQADFGATIRYFNSAHWIFIGVVWTPLAYWKAKSVCLLLEAVVEYVRRPFTFIKKVRRRKWIWCRTSDSNGIWAHSCRRCLFTSR